MKYLTGPVCKVLKKLCPTIGFVLRLPEDMVVRLAAKILFERCIFSSIQMRIDLNDRENNLFLLYCEYTFLLLYL